MRYVREFDIHPNYGDPYYDEVCCKECGNEVYDYTPCKDEEGNIEHPYCEDCLKEQEEW